MAEDARPAGVVVGGSGFVGRALQARLAADGRRAISVDRFDVAEPPDASRIVVADLLVDDLEIPAGQVFVVAGSSMPRPRRPWTTVLDNALTAARLAPHLAGRSVVLLSSVEVYGPAPGPLTEDTPSALPIPDDALAEWCDDALVHAAEPCLPWRSQELCERLLAHDPSGRWAYGMAKAAQELLVRRAVPADRLTVLRAANLFGAGQQRVLGRFVHAARYAGVLSVTEGVERTFVALDRVVDALVADLGPGVYNLGDQTIALDRLAELVLDTLGASAEVRHAPRAENDSCGTVDGSRLAAALGPEPSLEDRIRAEVARFVADDGPLFRPPLPVVVPPRPERPARVVDAQQRAMWTGVLKHGGPATTALAELLHERLELGPDHRLLLTNSGTTALRLAVLGTAGPPRPGDSAIVPSFTFAATAEVLLQLGYRVRFCDVDPLTWTLDPAHLDELLHAEPSRLVVSVDALGGPPDYQGIAAVAERHGAVIVGDSAAALGAAYDGRPVGTQLAAHSFSMSFAKTVTAAGAGGAVVVPATAEFDEASNWLRSSMLHEVHAAAAVDLVEVLDDLVDRRRAIAAIYDRLVARRPGLATQATHERARHCYVHYVLDVDPAAGPDRDALATGLAARGVETKPYYAPALHQGPWARGGSATLPVTESLVGRVLAIPMSSEMTTEEADRVVMAIDVVLGRQVVQLDRGVRRSPVEGREPVGEIVARDPDLGFDLEGAMSAD